LVSDSEEKAQAEGFREQVIRKRGRKWQETGEDCIMSSFVVCNLHQTSFRSSDHGE
jgi:hypothetical protein